LGPVWICSLRLGFRGFREIPGWNPRISSVEMTKNGLIGKD
jgi:hypothetical protein